MHTELIKLDLQEFLKCLDSKNVEEWERAERLYTAPLLFENSYEWVEEYEAVYDMAYYEVLGRLLDYQRFMEGIYEDVRGDIAAAQAMLETGNLTFKGSAVTPDQNNFCGLGVTSNGMKGCSFKTLRDGVRAQIQHLKAYASREELVNGCVDPRYAYVEKGCAPYVEWLGQKENPKGKGWASGAKYGDKIKEILREMESQSTGKGQKDKNV